MTESNNKLLNITETVEKRLPELIEVFVSYYGENEIERIKKTFNNMIIVGYCPPNKFKTITNNDKFRKSEEIVNKLLKQINVDDEKKYKKILFSNMSYEFMMYHPINQYIKYKDNMLNLFLKKRAVSFLNQFYEEVTEDNIDTFILNRENNQLEQIISLYKESVLEYKEYIDDIQCYIDYVNKCDLLKDELKKKYDKILIEELKDLFTEEEYKDIQSKFNNNYYSIWKCNSKTKNYLSFTLDSISLISAFNKKNEKLLVNEKSWKKESVLKDRILYFKNFGLDLGDDYSAYENNPIAKSLIPSESLIIRIEKTKENLYNKLINEYYLSLPEYKYNQKRILEFDLIDKAVGYNANAYENSSTFVCPNIQKTELGYQIKPLLFLSADNEPDFMDHKLIHELNHIYELNFVGIKNGNAYYSCGWDDVETDITNKNKSDDSLVSDDKKRKYELFNEIINEIIAKEISQVMINKNIFIFGDKESTKYEGSSIYEKSQYIVNDFWNKYKFEIIESRKLNNADILFDAIGKDNFNKLNELFELHNKYLSGSKGKELNNELKLGIETKKTKLFYEICDKRDKILKNMENHYSSKKVL